MLIENTDKLKLWLTNALRPLCDADPAALAKYVLALIKKNKSDEDVRLGMVDQLDVFLQQDTKAFVKDLFEAIDTKEYLNAKEDPEYTMEDEMIEDKLTSSTSGSDPIPGTSGAAGSANTSLNSSSTSGNANASSSTSLLNSSSSSGEVKSASSGEVKCGSSGAVNTSSSSVDSGKTSSPVFRFASTSPDNLTLAANIKTEPKSKRSSSSSRKEDTNRGLGGRDRGRFRRNKSRSPLRRSRSKSRERARRSWSPKDHHHQQQRGGRYRGGMRRSPIRRYDRDTWDRRRSPGARNRSPSPRSLNRSSDRYRRGYDNNLRGRSRSRSPIDRTRSRTPPAIRHAPRNDSSETQPTATVAPSVQSVVKTAEQTGSSEAVAPDGDIAGPIFHGNGNRCQDFDERGLCMRGELCPFDHGQNPVVLQDVGLKRTVQVMDVNLPGGLPFSGLGGPPLDFRHVRPHAQRPLIGMDGMMDATMPWGVPPGFHPRGGPRGRGLFLRHPGFPLSGPQRELISVPVMGSQAGLIGGQEMEQETGYPPMHVVGGMYTPRGMHGRGGGRGRGRGGFDHARLGAKQRTHNNCSLEVKRIPKEQNTISDLNSHFVQFGKITNIQISFDEDPESALITFSAPNEAYAAYKSTDAVLSNRFIRVFWHNGTAKGEKENEEGMSEGVPRGNIRDRLGAQQQEASEKMDMDTERVTVSGGGMITKTLYNPVALAAMKKEVSEEKIQAVEAIKKSQEQLAAQEQLKRLQEDRKKENLKLLNDLQKKQQTMLGEQIEQQKKLIHKLESSTTMTPAEKQQLMKLIKCLQESIENIKKGLDEGTHAHLNPTKPIGSSSSIAVKTKQETQRDILDAEMDLYNTELEGGDTIVLKRKVLELRAKAKAAGIYTRGARGGYRGIPMMRGFSRGRGSRGITTASRTVDRRTKTLYITGFPAPLMTEVMAHFAQFGIVTYRKQEPETPALTISYEHRKSAEIALVKARSYKEHQLNIQWVQNNPVPPQPKPFNNNGAPGEDMMDSGEVDESDMYETSVDEFFDTEAEQLEEEEDDDDERTWRR